MNRFGELKDLVMSLEGDFEKFYDKGNQAAGTRVRKGMQDLKNLAQDIRLKVQELKNTEETPAPKKGK
jgi:Histone H1-like protein Hc1